MSKSRSRASGQEGIAVLRMVGPWGVEGQWNHMETVSVPYPNRITARGASEGQLTKGQMWK